MTAKITKYIIRENKYDLDTFLKVTDGRILVQFITGLKEPVHFQLKTHRCASYQDALHVILKKIHKLRKTVMGDTM